MPIQLAGEIIDDNNPLITTMEAMSAVSSGEVIAGTAALQMPSIPCRLAYIRALDSNAGTVYLGGSGVTAPNGVADATSGYPMIASDAFGPLPIDNLSRLWILGSQASQSVSYIAVK